MSTPSTMISESGPGVHRCSSCSKSASQTCKACRSMPNDKDGQVSSTWYCGVECQKAHWTEHKAQCKAAQARQALYRAGATLQQVFYQLLKTAFMWNPGRIEKIGTEWFIYPRKYTGTSILVPFPYELVPDVHDQRALLTYQCCNAAVSDMHDIVKAFLTGLHIKIDEIDHYVKGEKYIMRRIYGADALLKMDATDYVHSIIRIKMKDGKLYVLDMAGAQYGWHESIMPWQTYHASRVREIREVLPFGGTRLYCKARANNMIAQGKWVHGIRQNFAFNVQEAVMWWQKHNISIIKLLSLPEPDFIKHQSSFLETVEEFLRISKTMQESKGAFDVKGGFQHAAFDRKFTSAALGMIPGRSSPPSKTT